MGSPVHLVHSHFQTIDLLESYVKNLAIPLHDSLPDERAQVLHCKEYHSEYQKGDRHRGNGWNVCKSEYQKEMNNVNSLGMRTRTKGWEQKRLP